MLRPQWKPDLASEEFEEAYSLNPPGRSWAQPRSDIYFGSWSGKLEFFTENRERRRQMRADHQKREVKDKLKNGAKRGSYHYFPHVLEKW